MSTRVLSGWGRATHSAATVDEPHTDSDVAKLVQARPHGRLIARGAGRSYGDAALNAGGHVADLRGLRSIGPIDERCGTVTAGAGATLGAILARTVPAGWMLPVVPGTQHVTVGGAIASDVHGKNHRAAGSFAGSVEAFGLVTSEGPRVVDAHSDPDLFWATAGGMGLTGVITGATLRLVPLRTPWFETVTWRSEVLGETLRILDRSAHQHAMAWLDPCAPSDRMGRGVITCGEPALAEAGHSPARRARSANDGSESGPALGVMHPSLIRLASSSYWRMAAPGPTERTERLETFLFPFDRLGSWNRLFGRRGLIQWQGVLPRGNEDALADVLASYRRHEVVSPLVSLKRFGRGNPGPLSFPIDGWTIAIDLPAAAPELGTLLTRLDSITAQAGGRVYLAKDSRLRPNTLRAMYPRLEEWCAVRRRADPAGLMCSDLARRLHLLEADA